MRGRMFQRRILPAEEELGDMVILLTFAAVWYSALFSTLDRKSVV